MNLSRRLSQKRKFLFICDIKIEEAKLKKDFERNHKIMNQLCLGKLIIEIRCYAFQKRSKLIKIVIINAGRVEDHWTLTELLQLYAKSILHLTYNIPHNNPLVCVNEYQTSKEKPCNHISIVWIFVWCSREDENYYHGQKILFRKT